MNQPNHPILETTYGIGGRLTPIVVCAKTGKELRRYPTQKNMITDAGLDAAVGVAGYNWFDYIAYARAGTGSTPTKDITNSSYTQTGTTVSRQSGSFAFTSGMVGQTIVFSDGQQARITAFSNSTTVTVNKTQTVPLPERPKVITSIVSTTTLFTVTATSHGLRVGDRITITGSSIVGYNATWLVASVIGANSFTVADTNNFGSATGGTFVKASCLGVLFRTNRTTLTTQVKSTNSYPVFIDTNDNKASQATYFSTTRRTVTLKRTYDFTEETANVNYTEVAISRLATTGELFSIILLAGAVTVEAGQLLRLIYELEIKHGGPPNEQPVIKSPIPGWPRPYNVTSITSTSSNFTVTLAEPHHYLAGGRITLNGIKKPRTAITAATSTSSDFTITAPGHSFSGGNVIAIEGVTPSGYNGTWTIASVSGDDITVTSVLNPGTGTAYGNVRLLEPQSTAIASITSDFDAFTISAPGHTITAGEEINVRGVTPDEYNGLYFATSVSGSNIVVADTRNLGAGTGGTVHERNTVWYDDEWAIFSVTSTTVVVATNLNPGTVHALEGVCTNNVRRKLGFTSFGVNSFTWSENVYVDTTLITDSNRRAAIRGTNDFNSFSYYPLTGDVAMPLRAGLSPVIATRPSGWPVFQDTTIAYHIINDPILYPNQTVTNFTSSQTIQSGTAAAYVAGSHVKNTVYLWGAGVGNRQDIRAVNFTAANASTRIGMYVDFEEPQRKDSTHKLVWTLRQTFTRLFTVDTAS